ncbi:MAG: ABC transporter substrate-binding protein [Spirochaetota bacterium]|nr:ABC transporter substrate-binding protein [Spirochaetota bacterium]
MMKRWRASSSFIMISIFLLFIVSYVYGSKVRGVTDTTIKLGGMADLTGPVAAVWIAGIEAMKDYFRYVNENGGIHGRKVINVVEDDRYSIPLALSAFKKLVFRDKVLFLLHAASGAGHTHAIIPVAEKNNVPMIAGTNDSRYFNPVRRHIFTPLPFYEDQIELIFEYILKDLKIKDPAIALAYPDSGAGNISRDTCRKTAKFYNIKKYKEQIISIGAGDFTSHILNLKRFKPDFVIIHGYVGSTSAFLRDAYKFKLKSIFIAVQYACVDDTIKIAGASAAGLIGTNGFCSWNDKNEAMTDIKKIVNKYHPEAKWRNRTFLQGWIWSILGHKGLENAGRNLSPKTLINGLERINNLDTKGLCGIVSYGPNDHKAIDYSRFYKADIKLKQFVPISDWRKPSLKEIAKQ